MIFLISEVLAILRVPNTIEKTPEIRIVSIKVTVFHPRNNTNPTTENFSA